MWTNYRAARNVLYSNNTWVTHLHVYHTCTSLSIQNKTCLLILNQHQSLLSWRKLSLGLTMPTTWETSYSYWMGMRTIANILSPSITTMCRKIVVVSVDIIFFIFPDAHSITVLIYFDISTIELKTRGCVSSWNKIALHWHTTRNLMKFRTIKSIYLL
jgi:hypothetical protein